MFCLHWHPNLLQCGLLPVYFWKSQTQMLSERVHNVNNMSLTLNILPMSHVYLNVQGH